MLISKLIIYGKALPGLDNYVILSRLLFIFLHDSMIQGSKGHVFHACMKKHEKV